MLKLTAKTIVKRIDVDVAETDIENKIVLLHIENGEYYNFNDTSSDLWQALKEPKQISSLATMLVEKYDCTLAEAEADIIEWLKDMLNKGLVEIS